MSVLIDDNDSLVQYSPPDGWFKKGEPPEFDDTTHASETSGDTAALPLAAVLLGATATEFDATTHTAVVTGSTAALVFEGTSIGVYGTLGTLNYGQSRLNFSIDGLYIGSYLAPLVSTNFQNTLFFISPALNETQHELVVTVDQNVAPLNVTLFLNYFIYTTTSTARKTLLVDDADASVTYSPNGWESSNSSDSCLGSTQHVSASVGSWAATSFNGTGISVVGSISQTGFNASVVIDGGQPVISRIVLEGNALGIDYFLVKGPPLAASTQSQPVPPSHTSATPQSPKKLPLVAIVGGAIGGLVILMLLGVAVIYKRRGRAHHDPTQPGGSILPRWTESNDDGLSITAPRPFQLLLQSQSTEPLPPPYVSISKNLPRAVVRRT
ncbi:hypothetical protein C8R45DRAFT_1089295 [Mycena sanguinolenta]|nr:hypothetical protein C8R45DRAFT_1089295 [Mycena sanguinolenta]